MRSISVMWRSLALVAVLLLGPVGLSEGLTEPPQARIGNPPGIAAQGRIGGPPGAPAAEGQSLWTRLVTWFLYYS
jgi:hypothetical protein